jgi:hypothetical protein
MTTKAGTVSVRMFSARASMSPFATKTVKCILIR